MKNIEYVDDLIACERILILTFTNYNSSPVNVGEFRCEFNEIEDLYGVE